MADPIKLELKEKDLNPGANTLKELKDFKKDFEAKLTEAKNKKTLEEAKALFPDVTFFYDADEHILQIGDVTMQATSEKQWAEWMSKMAADITSLNEQLSKLESQMKVEIDRALQEEKDKQKQIADEVKDNTSTEIDFSQKIKEKSWVSTFLTGTTTLEQAIDDKNDIELEAFRKTLLEALKKGQSEYENVFKDGGAATFNKKEWYTLQFIEAHKDELSKKDKKINWRAMKTEFNKGLDANGEPIEKPVDTKPTTPAVNTPTEKTYEQMTEVERISKAKDIMESLKNVQMSQEKDPVSGRMVNVVDLTIAQINAIQSINGLGGPTIGFDALGLEYDEVGPKAKLNPTERKNDRLIEKAQRLHEKGKYEKENKLLTKINDRFTDQRVTAQKINAKSQNIANERNRTQYNLNVSKLALDLAKGTSVSNRTVNVVPYTPLFTNICQSVTRIANGEQVVVDVAGLGPVKLRSPERYNLAFNNAFNGVAGQYGLDGQYALSGNSGGRGINQVESWITDHTRMNPEQAKGLTNGLLLGGGAFLLFKGMKRLFTGKTESKPLKETFRGRLALVGGGLWGLNKLSQLGTGQGIADVLKGVYTGKMTFQDLWKGTYSKYSPNSPEYLAGTNEAFNQAFRNVPYSSLLPYLEKGNNGYPKFTNISALILHLKVIESQTLDLNQKAAFRSQAAFLESLSKDPNGLNILNQAFVNMGLDYDKMKKTPDANTNSLSNEISERIKKYSDYLVEKGLQIKEGVKNATEKLLEYIKTGKPTLDELEKDGCFEKKNTTNPHSQDLSDPFVKFDTDGKKVDVDPKTVLDKSLWGIDLPLAKKLHLAQRELAGDSIDVKFKVDEKTGVLYLTSVGMLTPIMYDNDGWYIGGESNNGGGDPGVNHVNRFPTRFENAKNALWVAHLTNRLLNDFTGKYSVNKPFSASGEYRDLMVGKTSILESFTNTEALDGDTAKKLGGNEFSRNIKGYANYLNGICNTNGESVWNEKGKVGYDLRASFIENWAKSAMAMPKLKKEDEFDPNKKTTPDKSNPSPDKPNPTPDKKDKVDVNDPTKVLHDKDPEFTQEDIDLGNKWYEEFNHKDGGDATGKNPLERTPNFFHMWAKAFNHKPPMPYWTVDAYGMIGANKGKEIGIMYERPTGKNAPRRVKVSQGWYGHKERVNEKPQ